MGGAGEVTGNEGVRSGDGDVDVGGGLKGRGTVGIPGQDEFGRCGPEVSMGLYIQQSILVGLVSHHQVDWSEKDQFEDAENCRVPSHFKSLCAESTVLLGLLGSDVLMA